MDRGKHYQYGEGSERQKRLLSRRHVSALWTLPSRCGWGRAWLRSGVLRVCLGGGHLRRFVILVNGGEFVGCEVGRWWLRGAVG